MGRPIKPAQPRAYRGKEGGLSMKRIHTNISQEQARGRVDYRDRIDLLRSRVKLLTGKDKLLMTMYLENGNSFRQMASLAGVNEANIARRIYKVTRRLTEGEYITCLRNRDKFTKSELAVAKNYFLQGLSIRKIADKQNCSYYRIRQTLKKIRQLVSTI